MSDRPVRIPDRRRAPPVVDERVHVTTVERLGGLGVELDHALREWPTGEDLADGVEAVREETAS